jgi:hypothetical protein
LCLGRESGVILSVLTGWGIYDPAILAGPLVSLHPSAGEPGSRRLDVGFAIHQRPEPWRGRCLAHKRASFIMSALLHK